MRRIQTRLRNLEARLTDTKGLITGSKEWLAYWTDWIDRVYSGENLPGKIPLEAWDTILQASKAAQ